MLKATSCPLLLLPYPLQSIALSTCEFRLCISAISKFLLKRTRAMMISKIYLPYVKLSLTIVLQFMDPLGIV